jgi:cytochrome c biogenesis protein CcdA/thiol-disulfide isomerase/thioredoxin
LLWEGDTVVTLILIGFLGGLVTGISPCILPVVPVIFAAGAASGLPEDDEEDTAPATPNDVAESTEVADHRELVGATVGTGAAPGVPGTPGAPGAKDRTPQIPDPATSEPAPRSSWSTAELRRHRRPLAVVGGLVLSFSLATLIGSWFLDLLGLPQDILRWIGLVVLGVVGLGLIVPPLGDLLERPFARLSRGKQYTRGGGFVLGLSLGLVFVPCAGPVLAAISSVSSSHHFGFSAFVLTAAFALGVAVPLLIFAILGQRLAGRMRVVGKRAVMVRRVIGVVLVATAVILAFNVTDGLQRDVPGYTTSLQNQIEGNSSAKAAIDSVTGEQTGGAISTCVPSNPTLQECGAAPAIRGITQWLNTPGGKPVSLAELKGRVVLVDFWTYSCINCQRALPHVEAWNRAYGAAGLTVIGVQTPEFAFEHVVSNVSQAAKQLGVQYPIAIDNNYATWNAYENNYWPADYLIDATGHIRHVDFGEGDYSQTESFIRQLLLSAHPKAQLPKRTDVADKTPDEQLTPESYLGYKYPQDLVGQTEEQDQMADYQAPTSLSVNEHAYEGQWLIGPESSTAGQNAKLSLSFEAKNVYLVMGGSGTIKVSVNGIPSRTVTISGEPRLYQLFGSGTEQQAVLSLSFSPGLQAYDFTFG